MVRVCFVCSGNICRSPTAEVVLRRLAEQAGCGHWLAVDSAGIGDWHAGDDMDARSRATLTAAGYPCSRHAAKQFTAADFAERDVVVALDRGHLQALWSLAGETSDVAGARAKVVLLRSFDAAAAGELDVPDPYFGVKSGFAEVLAQVERGCAGLLAQLLPQAARRSG